MEIGRPNHDFLRWLARNERQRPAREMRNDRDELRRIFREIGGDTDEREEAEKKQFCTFISYTEVWDGKQYMLCLECCRKFMAKMAEKKPIKQVSTHKTTPSENLTRMPCTLCFTNLCKTCAKECCLICNVRPK